MGLLILAAFIAVPLIEIGLFIQVGGAIGLWPTLIVVVATAMAGTALLRHQGLGALARLQDAMNRGETPLEPVFDGFCLLAAGALLLTPGFFTDGVGFLLFVPAFRRALRNFFAQRIQVRGQMHAHMHMYGQPPKSEPSGDVIDGEWQDITDLDQEPKLPPHSGPSTPKKDE